MIRARGLTKRYGEHIALHAVDLDVHPGTLVAITGPNGSGKSTLLRCLAGLTDHEGTVWRPTGALGFLPQSPALPPLARAAEIVDLFAGLGARASVGLPVAPARPIGQLSGGEQHRVALAALLALGAPVLLLDEPTAALDTAARSDLLAELARRRDAGTTIVLTTPTPFADELGPICDGTVALERGRLHAVSAAHRQRAAG